MADIIMWNVIDFNIRYKNIGFEFQVHEDSDVNAFPIKIISATTNADWKTVSYIVEFETKSKLQAKTVWFSVYKEQRYPIVCKYIYKHTYSSHPCVILNKYLLHERVT